jgi:small subunit ribosomal protein S18
MPKQFNVNNAKKAGYGKRYGARMYSLKKKQCQFCRKKIDQIDFRDVGLLSKFLTQWGKIRPGRETGNCAKHQRRLTEAMKYARFMALMPYFKR